jgi:hypothetical protein
MKSSSQAWKEIALGTLFLALNVYVLVQVFGSTWGMGSTVFAQPYGDGLTCGSPNDCLSRFCVNNTCCNQACNLAYQFCNVAGQEGTCVTRQPAPALSPWGQMLASAALALAGAYLLTRGVRNRRRG